MADAKQTADKYIQRGGAPAGYGRDEYALDLSKVANFLLWHDKNAMRGSIYPDEAFEAFCRLVNVEPHRIREIIRPEQGS